MWDSMKLLSNFINKYTVSPTIRAILNILKLRYLIN